MLDITWPKKVHKFEILDPCLRMLTAKYEGLVNWGQISSASALASHVRDVMLPALLRLVTQGAPGAYFVHEIDLERSLANDHLSGIEDLRLVRQRRGDEAARRALLESINARKARAFDRWVELSKGPLFANHPAFSYLMLRPIFRLSPRGHRQAVMEASRPVALRVLRAIQKESVHPNVSLAKLYGRLASDATAENPGDGWSCFESPGDAGELSRLSRGAGWCTAEPEVAGRYLVQGSTFYILRAGGKPVVALRSRGGKVVEARSRRNSEPRAFYFAIDELISDLNLRMGHNTFRDYEAVVAASAPAEAEPESWWRKRAFRNCLAKPDCDRMWRIFEQRFGWDLSPTEWISLLEKLPERYTDVPPQTRRSHGSGLLAAASRGWAWRVESAPDSYEFCPTEILKPEWAHLREAAISGWIRIAGTRDRIPEDIPRFVGDDRRFQEALDSRRSRTLRRSPATGAEYAAPAHILDLFAPSERDREAAHEIVLGLILTGDLAETKTPQWIRDRDDHENIRLSAWREAVRLQPPYLFAVPVELRNAGQLAIETADTDQIEKGLWLDGVWCSPWVLESEQFPAPLRRDAQILGAYVEAWASRLRACPWQPWDGQHYMSRAIQKHPAIIAALRIGWLDQDPRNLVRVAETLLPVPFLQLSLLKALGASRQFRHHKKTIAKMMRTTSAGSVLYQANKLLIRLSR